MGLPRGQGALAVLFSGCRVQRFVSEISAVLSAMAQHLKVSSSGNRRGGLARNVLPRRSRCQLGIEPLRPFNER